MGRPSLVPKTQTQPQPTHQQIIDEFGELDRRIQAFSPTVKRHKALQETIRGWYANHPADQPAIAEGHAYEVQVSPRTEERYFSVKAKLKIFARMGKAAAIEAFSITLKAVEDALGKSAMESLVSKSHSGTRKLVPVMKAPANQAA